MSKGLTDFEKEVLDLVKKSGEVMASHLPPRMMGAIPKLRNSGLVEVFKRKTSPWSSRKFKFVKVKEVEGK